MYSENMKSGLIRISDNLMRPFVRNHDFTVPDKIIVLAKIFSVQFLKLHCTKTIKYKTFQYLEGVEVWNVGKF